MCTAVIMFFQSFVRTRAVFSTQSDLITRGENNEKREKNTFRTTFCRDRVKIVNQLVDTQMDSLPDEIIELICGYLTTQDLLRVTLVDRRLRWIVENSPNLMAKIPIFLCDNDLEFCNVEFDDDYHHNRRLIEPLLESKKKVRKVIVELRSEKIIKFAGVFRKFSDTIRHLEIKNYAFDTIEQLRIILRYAINLQKLTVHNVTFLKTESFFLKSTVSKYDNLKTIDVVNCDLQIFSLFSFNSSANIRLREIKFVSSVSDNDVTWRISYESLIELLTHQQRGLVKLRLDGVNFDLDNFSDCLKHLKFDNLRYLEILNCKVERRETAKNIVELIKSQKHLTNLKLLKTPLSIDSIEAYRKMFSNKKIEEAALDIDEKSMIHSHSLSIGSIKKLTLRGNFAFENLPIFVNVIKLFPNVRKLILEGGSPINEKYLHNILSTFVCLEELQIPGFTSRTGDSNFSLLQSIDNHQLKSLTLEYIDYDVKFFGWKNIVTNLQSIQKLVIKRNYGKVSKELIDMIIKRLNLKHLELGIGNVSDEIIEILVHCKMLKTLKISSCDFKKMSSLGGKFEEFIVSNQILFHICNDNYFAKKATT